MASTPRQASRTPARGACRRTTRSVDLMPVCSAHPHGQFAATDPVEQVTGLATRSTFCSVGVNSGGERMAIVYEAPHVADYGSISAHTFMPVPPGCDPNLPSGPGSCSG